MNAWTNVLLMSSDVLTATGQPVTDYRALAYDVSDDVIVFATLLIFKMFILLESSYWN